jgi:cysteine desulfurase / selenocysteine lyase
LNESQAAAAKGSNETLETPQVAPVAPTLQPALSPDLISGTRPFDAYAIKRDFPILHQQVHGKPLIWLDNYTADGCQAGCHRLSLKTS